MANRQLRSTVATPPPLSTPSPFLFFGSLFFRLGDMAWKKETEGENQGLKLNGTASAAAAVAVVVAGAF